MWYYKDALSSFLQAKTGSLLRIITSISSMDNPIKIQESTSL